LLLKFSHPSCRSPHSGQSLFLTSLVAVLLTEGISGAVYVLSRCCRILSIYKPPMQSVKEPRFVVVGPFEFS
jgi:hypothetical protein